MPITLERCAYSENERLGNKAVESDLATEFHIHGIEVQEVLVIEHSPLQQKHMIFWVVDRKWLCPKSMYADLKINGSVSYSKRKRSPSKVLTQVKSAI